MSERFYLNSPLALGPIVLHGPEAHHLATVSRLRRGDQVILFNGDGREYAAEVAVVERKTVTLRVLGIESTSRELPFRLIVAAPLPKGDRAQFLLEKLTELGVATFVPLRSRRSVVHPRETRLDKLERYVIEASKQCGRNALLRVEPLSDWEEFCRREDLPAYRVLAHPGGAALLTAVEEDVAVAVGPEGGWMRDEVALAEGAGWRQAGLGRRTLRVETAALVLAARLSGERPG
jgi:16S rRNA (uracil1498-N3)-methyltransferase